MPSLIKQGEARVVTKDGEVFVNIALDLTIKLEGTPLKDISSVSGGSNLPGDSDKVNWQIPDFSSGKINFGK